MTVDISYLSGLENPLLLDLAPDLVKYRDDVRALSQRRKSGCTSCEGRRIAITLISAVSKLRTYVLANDLTDVYEYLRKTAHGLQPAFDHA